MKFLSMVIGMSILLYVVYTIIKNDYEYLNNHSLMMTCIVLIASPVLIILIKFEVELYSHYKKRDDVKK